jgi:hypothetical protein
MLKGLPDAPSTILVICFIFERIREYFLAEVHNIMQSPGSVVDFSSWSSCVCHEAIKE